MGVRELGTNPINVCSLAERNLREAGLIVSAPLWREKIDAAAASDVAWIRADLPANPYAYVANAAAVAEILAEQSKATTSGVSK